DFPDIVDLELFKKIRIQESGSLKYLSFKIAIELIKPEMRKSLESNNEIIRNTVESEAKKMSWLVLRSPEGKINFKYHLIQKINEVLPSKMIQNIYFTGFMLE
ncbi:MAG: flagellar basal body-associated FliL family protein, partial [Desulfamplus sp.]|nr:flagellar basal body-associated FliL family protein [Desulfamplus sp.]